MDDIRNRSEKEKERRAELTRAQRDMAVLDSDVRKTQVVISNMEQEMRNIRRKKDNIRMQEDDLNRRLKKAENEKRMQMDDMRRLKRKLSTI